MMRSIPSGFACFDATFATNLVDAIPTDDGMPTCSLIAALIPELRQGINCLVKGSRSMGMEAVVEAIQQDRGMREAG